MLRDNSSSVENRGWMEQFIRYRNITTLDRAIAVSLIEQVLIYREHRVEIVFRWHTICGHQRASRRTPTTLSTLNSPLSRNLSAPDIELCSIKTDIGYTGLNFNRPAFQKMMDEIDSGKINCVIVKELSRFSRNHLDAGDMIFHKFAATKVRFIAVLDDVDE